MVHWLADVSMTPDPSALPGSAELQRLTDGIGFWGLALSLIALIVSAVLWATGAHAQNYQSSAVGKRGVLIAGVAALLIGASPALVNFFFHAGQSVR